MRITRETVVEASADFIWTVLGPRYAEADKWASSVQRSSGLGAPAVGAAAGAPCTGRVCETQLGRFEETIERYDEANREIAYSARGEKMPFFVRRLVNHWKVVPDGPGRSRVQMELVVTLAFPFNLLMALPMRLQMGGVLRKAHEELKYFVENDETPHPRKLQAQRELASVGVA